MSRPTFLEGVAVALAASAGAGAAFVALGALVHPALALRALVALLGLGYLAWLLARSRARIGRVSALALWAVATGAAFALDAPLALHVLVQAAIVWLVRSLRFHASVLGALADLGLCALGVAGALWALVASGSVLLAVWCLFLVQAPFAAIPGRRPRPAPDAPDADDRFERAHRAAEAALHRLGAAL